MSVESRVNGKLGTLVKLGLASGQRTPELVATIAGWYENEGATERELANMSADEFADDLVALVDAASEDAEADLVLDFLDGSSLSTMDPIDRALTKNDYGEDQEGGQFRAMLKGIAQRLQAEGRFDANAFDTALMYGPETEEAFFARYKL